MLLWKNETAAERFFFITSYYDITGRSICCSVRGSRCLSTMQLRETSAYDARTIDFARRDSFPAAHSASLWRLSKLLLITKPYRPIHPRIAVDVLYHEVYSILLLMAWLVRRMSSGLSTWSRRPYTRGNMPQDSS
jgi:hypothetical protein